MIIVCYIALKEHIFSRTVDVWTSNFFCSPNTDSIFPIERTHRNKAVVIACVAIVNDLRAFVSRAIAARNASAECTFYAVGWHIEFFSCRGIYGF